MKPYNPDWTWMRDVDGPPATTYGDDIEIMWHGGTTARGNLHGCLAERGEWALVVAYKLHGKIPHSDLDTIYGLVWEARPGINKVDHSYLRLVDDAA